MKEHLPVLKRTKIFCGLTEDEILSAVGCLRARPKQFKKGAMLYREGDAASFIGVILSGEIETQKTDFYGNANIISKLFPSDLIAAAASYSTEKRLPFDVVAMSETEILCFDNIKMISTCNKACGFHFKVIENLLRVVADKNIDLSSKIDILTKRTIREKVLSYLYTQLKKAKSQSFSISLSRRQMADFLSIDRSALSRELGRMRDEEILDFDNNIFRFNQAQHN